MKETEIQAEIMTYLEYRGIECWRNNVGRRGGISFGEKGQPDIEGCLPDGRYLGIEVKRPKGKMSPEQKSFHIRIKRNNGVIFVAHSVEEVHEKLDELS